MKKKRERERVVVERVERKRERRRREVGRAAASERTVKPPFERNRLGDEFEREGRRGETVRRRGCGGGYKHGDGKSLLIS